MSFISAAQARLNFCPKLYVDVMVNINKAITELSRIQRMIEVPVPTEDGTHIHVRTTLEENGFRVYSTKVDDQTFNMRIEW